MTNIATSIFVGRTSGSTADPVNILIALAAVLGEINSCPEHTANVGVSLVESFLNDRVDERTTVEKHSLIRLR